MIAHALTVSDYQALLDRNWRRSGNVIYRPHQRRTCCPMYTIRLDVTRFQPSRSQKKVLRKIRNYGSGGAGATNSSAGQADGEKKSATDDDEEDPCVGARLGCQGVAGQCMILESHTMQQRI